MVHTKMWEYMFSLFEYLSLQIYQNCANILTTNSLFGTHNKKYPVGVLIHLHVYMYLKKGVMTVNCYKRYTRHH